MIIQQKQIEKLEGSYQDILRLVDIGELISSLILSRNMIEEMAYLILTNEEISFEPRNKNKMIDLIPDKTGLGIFNSYLKRIYFLGNKALHTRIIGTSKEELINDLNVIWGLWLQYLNGDEYINQNGEKISSISLYSFDIANYQGIGQIESDILPLDTQFIVFTGENGYGKTSILQALAIAFYGNEDAKFRTYFTGQEECSISIHYRFPYQGLINSFFGGHHSLFSNLNPLANFAAYGASRLQLQSEESMEQSVARRNPAYHLFYTDGILLNIEHWLSKQRDELKENIIEALGEVLPNIEKIEMNHQKFSFKDHNDLHDISTLSAGHKSIFAMIGDMMIRLFEAQPKAKNTKELIGVVLIDELESHLHPKWQKEFPSLLAKLFPKVQFIVTTHSAICFLGMPKNSIFYHVLKDEEGKIGIEKIEIDIENLLPNHILTSPIFGMENIKNIENVDAKKVPTSELSYDEIKKRAETQAQLKKLAEKFVFPEHLQK